MDALHLQDWLNLTVLVAFVAAIYFGHPLWVTFTQSSADAVRIKVLYEGMDGPAGPHTKVLGIERKGTRIGGYPGSSSCRKYEVQLQKADGRTLMKTVEVEASLFGQGSISEGR